MVPDIEIQHLSVCFDTAQGPVYAVNDLSTTFRAGRISGVIGESGSGKSVMGMSLLRLLPNTARVTGKCFFGEDELYSMPLRRLRRLRGAAIGLIPQNPGASLDPVMKLRRQLTEAITTHGRWKRREAEAQAAELLRRFGFEEPERILNQYSFQMSGGMNQRLVSALGLACRPGWVIADEPTPGLHITAARRVLSHFREIADQGAGVLLITHDLGIVANFCDAVSIMYAGEIIEQGTLEDIFDKEREHHPYTIGLFGSIPNIEDQRDRLSPIPGLMPDPTDLPKGCKFHTRCPKCTEQCKDGEVPVHVRGTHQIKCRLIEDAAANGGV